MTTFYWDLDSRPDDGQWEPFPFLSSRTNLSSLEMERFHNFSYLLQLLLCPLYLFLSLTPTLAMLQLKLLDARQILSFILSISSVKCETNKTGIFPYFFQFMR